MWQSWQEYKNKRLYGPRYAEKYFGVDEALKSDPHFRYYCSLIRGQLAKIKVRGIRVLDIGCGTGRYWECFRAAKQIVGVDASMPMLNEAHKKAAMLGIDKKVKLMHGNINSLTLNRSRFDFVMSIGVLGEHTYLTNDIINRIYRALTPQGRIFITLVDEEESKVHKSWVRIFIEKLIPSSKYAFTLYFGPYYMKREVVEGALGRAGFKNILVRKYVDLVHHHLIITASK